MSSAEKSFTIKQAARLSKLSLTMVEYLCRTEVLRPSGCHRRGRGCRREYSFGDVVLLRAIAKLLENGISVSKLKKSLLRLRRHHPEITSEALPASLLVTDGKQVFFRESNEVLLELSKGQLAFAFVLELSAIQQEIMRLARNELSDRRKRA
jgi:DNA-binding transcriptional MerR regulator